MANGEPMSDERKAERLALQELGRLAQTLNAMRKDGSRPSLEPAPGSVLAGDDRHMAPWHLSHTAWTSLTIGVEHLEAATRHISQFRRLDPHAPYAQIRAGLEAAATAIRSTSRGVAMTA